jgi:cell shape-determining protein MreC
MKKTVALLIIGFFFMFVTSHARASYVLPYPSFMPGNKIYKITRLIDKVKAYWYWGELGQAKYHTALADKYLVEAKVLFEYKQYLLAVDALKRSNEHVEKASNEEQRAAHVQVLTRIKEDVPEEFTWTPEKDKATKLSLYDLIDAAIALRTP